MFYLTEGYLPFFLPLGFIGIYRWLWYLVRLLATNTTRRPLSPPAAAPPRYTPSRDVTILVPTIDTPTSTLSRALASWLANDPYEIILITTPPLQPSLLAAALAADPVRRRVSVATVRRADKRCQMVAGANRVATAVTVFCDDDVVWPSTMLEYLLVPMEEDERVAGVGTSQRVIPVGDRMTIWEVFAAFRITMRNIEVLATTRIDGGVCCLSGRTAAYRTSILHDPVFQHAFTNERWGPRGRYRLRSGDDKFLTRWLHSRGHRTFVQGCAEAELGSTFSPTARGFARQLTRWTRNTWRSDWRSVAVERRVWARHPFVAACMVDKFCNPVTVLAGPAVAAYLVFVRATGAGGAGAGTARREEDTGTGAPAWAVAAGSYVAWVLVTRLVKYAPHFARHPAHVVALPAWVLFGYFFAVLKLYCLMTLHVTEWGTRAGADAEEADDGGSSDPVDPEIFAPHWREKKRRMEEAKGDAGGGREEGQDASKSKKDKEDEIMVGERPLDGLVLGGGDDAAPAVEGGRVEGGGEWPMTAGLTTEQGSAVTLVDIAVVQPQGGETAVEARSSVEGAFREQTND
ncbi:glycosyltransferase like family 2-domain-containing protein [Zopfochytrium polystomum]|nr:glycosyltransferase like family 2-domain-containing protein [Zopfochytrium polystomum]